MPLDPDEVLGRVRRVGFLKGKSAVRIHRQMQEKRVYGMHLWSVGYCVSTVGPLDEQQVRRYIREQEKLASSQGHLKFQ